MANKKMTNKNKQGEEHFKESDFEGCQPIIWRQLRIGRGRGQKFSVKLCGT